MRIQFVVPSLSPTGGVRVVFEHASRLRARGHEVTILAPELLPPLHGRERLQPAAWKHYLYERFSGKLEGAVHSYGLKAAVARFSPRKLEAIPSADATLATAWITAEWVHAMPEHAGRKYYFIQGYEAWTDELRPKVDATWAMPLRKIVVAKWLQRRAQELFGDRECLRVPNGVDSERFRPGPTPSPATPLTIGSIYDLSPLKGCSDGLDAFWRIHRELPSTRFSLLGRARLRHKVPPLTTYFRDPSQEELPEAYRSADIFLFPSLQEGFSLVTLEALASGCALVATSVGEAVEMGIPTQDYLLLPPREPGAMANACISLLRDRGRLTTLRQAGRRLAESYSWDSATDLLESILVS